MFYKSDYDKFKGMNYHFCDKLRLGWWQEVFKGPLVHYSAVAPINRERYPSDRWYLIDLNDSGIGSVHFGESSGGDFTKYCNLQYGTRARIIVYENKNIAMKMYEHIRANREGILRGLVSAKPIPEFFDLIPAQLLRI